MRTFSTGQIPDGLLASNKVPCNIKPGGKQGAAIASLVSCSNFHETQPKRTLSGLMGSRWHSFSMHGAGQARADSSSLHQSHLHLSCLLWRMQCTVSHLADVCGHQRLEKVRLEGAEKSWCIKRDDENCLIEYGRAL